MDDVIAVEQEVISTSRNATAVSESRTKAAQLTEARNGWQGILDRNYKTLEDAKKGSLTHVTGLVADALLYGKSGGDSIKFINGTSASGTEHALRAISALR